MNFSTERHRRSSNLICRQGNGGMLIQGYWDAVFVGGEVPEICSFGSYFFSNFFSLFRSNSMISVNFKRNALSALVAVGVMTMAAAASAAVVGGGATLPEELYGKAKFPTSSTGILNKTPAPGFNTYVGIGSGGGKNSFFQNNSNLLVWDHDGNPATANVPFYSTPVTVDYAGSDSLVTAAEQTAYDNHTTLGKTSFGRLIQVPTVLTSVT
ncbi:MAG: hypothetical protein ACT6R2_21225, partial [Blastomonas fulva]